MNEQKTHGLTIKKHEPNTIGLTRKKSHGRTLDVYRKLTSWLPWTWLFSYSRTWENVESRLVLHFPNQKILTIMGEGKVGIVGSYVLLHEMMMLKDVGHFPISSCYPRVPLRSLIQKVPLTQTISGTPPSNWVPQEGILGFFKQAEFGGTEPCPSSKKNKGEVHVSDYPPGN